jgi:hypothetical protein
LFSARVAALASGAQVHATLEPDGSNVFELIVPKA